MEYGVNLFLRALATQRRGNQARQPLDETLESDYPHALDSETGIGVVGLIVNHDSPFRTGSARIPGWHFSVTR